MSALYQRKRRRQAVGQADTIPAPVGGWNTRDALDSMSPTDATLLDNWFPSTGSVKKRPGHVAHVTGFGSGNVDTLAEFHAGTTRHLIVGANGNLYNGTSAATSIGSGFSNNQWQVQNFNGSIFLFNGTDAPQDWDGTTLSATAWSGSGLTITDLIGVNAYKNRLYMWEDDSQDFWYAAAAAVTGALTKFPLSRVGQFGGNLVAMSTWTHDGGSGVDDHAVFIMSSGDVIVYSGSDPSDATDFLLVGVYHIGTPLGIRGIVRIGGDLLIMTSEDYVSLSAVLKSGQLGTASKLSGAVIAAADVGSALFGWQAVVHRKGEMIVFNVPVSGSEFDQHIINSVTGAPTRFKDVVSRCWGVFNDALYFGSTDGAVYKISGESDAGTAIDCDGRQAWRSMSGRTTRISAARPILKSVGALDIGFAVGVDYQDAVSPAPSSIAPVGTAWDTELWDTFQWADEGGVDVGWQAEGVAGQSISPRLTISSTQAVSWLRTDYRAEPGISL